MNLRIYNTNNLEQFFKIALPSDDFLKHVERHSGPESKYPPYNVLQTGRYTKRIEFAIAGFSRDEVDVEVEKKVLRVTGEKKEADNNDTNDDKTYTHRGIASRRFVVELPLLGTHKVQSANLVHGILSIDVKDVVPEEDRPKKINIGSNEYSSIGHALDTPPDEDKQFLAE